MSVVCTDLYKNEVSPVSQKRRCFFLSLLEQKISPLSSLRLFKCFLRCDVSAQVLTKNTH